jgi:DNA-binding MarR family transcriptional regulator
VKDEDPVHFRLFNEIGIINQLAQSIFEGVMPDGMTLAQFSVLNRFVRLGGSNSPAELADAFQVTRGTMTSTLQKLEAKGLVAIKADRSDGRAKLVSLTAAGRSVRDKCLKRLEPELTKIAAHWPATQVTALLEPLTALRQQLDRMRG